MADDRPGRRRPGRRAAHLRAVEHGRRGGKRAYLALEEDPELELEFYVAERLGKSLTELRESMGQQEWVLWTRYFARKAQAQELELKKAGG